MRRKLLVLSLLVLALTACGDKSQPAAGAAAGGQQMPPPLPVETAKAQMLPLGTGFETVGSLRADESVVVRPEVAGKIVKIGFAEGGRVAKGQLLFALDASTLQALANEARVNLETSRVAFKRASELVGRKLVSQSDFDLTRAKLAVDEARLASARTMLAKMELRAPFAGQVGLRQVSVGDYVNAGQDLLTLVNLDPVEVDFSVPETMLAQLQSGREISIAVDSYAGESFKGTVVAIDPVIDPNSRSAKMRAQLRNPDYRLRPGQFARLSLSTGDADATALMIPEQALMQEGEQRYVYTVVGGKAKKSVIRTGRRIPGQVEVTEGLKAGDEVITAGQTKPMMFDGAAVAPMGGQPGQAAPAKAQGG